MRRREFVTLIGGAAAWPVASRAQQAGKLPTIGWLDSVRSPVEASTAFNQGLAEAGYVVGRNLNLEYRSAEGDNGKLPALAAEFVRQGVAVIVTTTGTAVLVAKAAT